MLKIGYGRNHDCILHADWEFEDEFEYSWLQDPMNLRILKEIDHAEFYNGAMRDLDETDRIFGVMDISTGSKGLMLVNMLDEPAIWGTLFGDNCTDILLDLAGDKDVTIYLNHLLYFPEQKFKAFSLTQNREYADYSDYRKEARSCLIEIDDLID